MLGSIESDAYQEIGRLPVGRHQLEFNVTVKSGETPRRRIVVGGRKRPPELPQILWQGPISFTVDVVDDIDNVIPAVSGIEITEAVRQSLHPSINNSEGGLGTSIQISPPPKLFEKFKNTAISLKVEFRREERAVETIEYDAVCVDSEILESPSISWDTGRDPLLEIPQNLLEDENAQRDWDIRITGTNKGILHFWDAERRWNGEIVVPLREVLKKKL
ncbi:MAG: hypothetical protein ACKVS6_13355 [Planctomycetota bacterium]